MSWTTLDTWIVITGALAAAACALPGAFLVLRGMSMMGDAISHAVLPGLAVAFLVTGSRDSVAMFVGAAAVGVLTALLTQWVRSLGKVDESASMGVVFTALFAVGLLVMVRGADAVDLDPGCVLYGAIEYVPLNTVALGPVALPRAVLSLGAVLVVNVLLVAVLYKEFKISSFDPELATTMGIPATFMHYLLMAMVAVTTVAAFESVGSILVIAMLIVPGATAFLLTERLSVLLLLSLVAAVLCSVLGHVGAVFVPGALGYGDVSTAGMMAVAAGGLFALAWVLAPRRGLLSQWVHRRSVRLRIAREDLLGLMYRVEEHDRTAEAAMTGPDLRQGISAGPVTGRLALRGLLRRRKVERTADRGYRLTADGRDEGRGLIRSHRLWESYLVKFLNLRADHVDRAAEQLEHVTDERMRERLDERVDRPSIDPQGKQIPEEPAPGPDRRA